MIQSLSTAALTLVAFSSAFYHLILRTHPGTYGDDKRTQQTVSTRPLIELFAHAFSLRDRHASSAILSTLEGLEAVTSPLAHKLASFSLPGVRNALMKPHSD
jgi:hypothetical protein